MVQTCDFLRKYVAESERLNWDTEAACRASMREVYKAAEDYGISTAMQTPGAWASLVALMNMPERKMEVVLKKMYTANPMASNSMEPCLPTMQMCNNVSRDEEAKNYMNKGMRKAKEASRRSRTPLRKSKESALLDNSGDQRPRASNLGCYCCGEFGHLKRECTVDPKTVPCMTCETTGHVAEVCLNTHDLYGSRPGSLSQA